MKRKPTSFCFLLMLVPFIGSCSLFEKNYEQVFYNDGREETNRKATIESSIPNGKEISILPSAWMDYYQKSKQLSDIQNYYTVGTENSYPESVVISWTNKDVALNYSFLIADSKEMENPVSIECYQKQVNLTELFAGNHYYYQIKAEYKDRYVVSKRFDFKTADFIRTAKIYGALNCRDIGNKKTNDKKKRVKQGLVYRSANLDLVNNVGKERAKTVYGIKTDLDLREQAQIASPLGTEIKYVNNGVGDYGSPLYVSVFYGVNTPEYQVAMRENLRVFSDKNNFPLVFHCAVGRDRTGTLAITLLLLLGVNIDEIKQDYAVSFFSKACNNEDFEAYKANMENLFKYYNSFRFDGATDNTTIYERVEQYALHIGLTSSEISAIRSNLLEDIKK